MSQLLEHVYPSNTSSRPMSIPQEMSYSQVTDHPYNGSGSRDDICDYIDQPLDLNQENIKLFEQQQNHQHHHPQAFQQFHPQESPVFHVGPSPYYEQNPTSTPQWQGQYNGIPQNQHFQPPIHGNVPQGMNAYVPNVPQDDSLFKAESVSSTQLSLERDLNGNIQQPWNGHSNALSATGHQTDSSPSGSPNDIDFRNDKGKGKKQRALILTEREEAVMNRDDLELNEEELKIKKKAHNRLAQRAFRERKKTELKDLEDKLLQSEEERQKLLQVLQDIKQTKSDDSLLRDPANSMDLENSRFSFPSSQDEFINQMVDRTKHNVNPATINKVYEQPESSGHKVLAVGAVWDFLQIKAEEDEYYGVDMYEVMQLLKGSEKCHGYGPAYELRLVEQALEKVRTETKK